MANESIQWQYVAKVLDNNPAEYASFPLGDIDFMRFHFCSIGGGIVNVVFVGGTSLPAGYQEKNDVALDGEFIIGADTYAKMDLINVTSCKISPAGPDCGVIIQGIKCK